MRPSTRRRAPVDYPLLGAILAGQAASPPLRVAITVDDLPVHGPLPEGTTRLRIHERLLEAFAAHRVPAVYGFVNAGRAGDDPALLEALDAWVAAGHPVGNHTYAHPVMDDVGVEAFIQDIDANEAILRRLMDRRPESEWKWFRYPFLKQGFDDESTSKIRSHLKASGYRVAEVTIDFYDWAWNAPYARCKAQGNDAAIEALPEELRSAIQLRELDGMSYEEIAKLMDCPIGTVRSRIFRAREAIAERLKPLLDSAKDKRW